MVEIAASWVEGMKRIRAVVAVMEARGLDPDDGDALDEVYDELYPA